MKYLAVIVLLMCPLWAESIKSITGNIIFDIDNDGTSEVHLSSDGLAVGSGLSPSANLHVSGNWIVSEDLVIGGTAGNSTLEVQGTIGYGFQTISSNTTLSGNSIVLVDTSSDNIEVDLPYAGNVNGRNYTIKKISTSNEITLSGGGNNIDSYTSYLFTSGNMASIEVVSDGSAWNVVSSMDDGLQGSTSQLYVYESFDYSAGSLHGQSGGTGFADSWSVSVGANVLEVIGTGLSYSTLPVAGNKGGRTSVSTRDAASRTLSTSSISALTQDNTTIWISFLYQRNDASDVDSKFLFSTEPFAGNSSTGALSSAGYAFGFEVDSGSTLIAIKADNSASTTQSDSGVSVSNATTYLIACKINWKPNGTNDEFYLFNVTDLSNEPSEGSAIATLTDDFDQSNFDTLTWWDRRISYYDEIRIGNTFEAVMGE